MGVTWLQHRIEALSVSAGGHGMGYNNNVSRIVGHDVQVILTSARMIMLAVHDKTVLALQCRGQWRCVRAWFVHCRGHWLRILFHSNSTLASSYYSTQTCLLPVHGLEFVVDSTPFTPYSRLLQSAGQLVQVTLVLITARTLIVEW